MKKTPICSIATVSLLNAAFVIMLFFIPGDSYAQEKRKMRDIRPIGTPPPLSTEVAQPPSVDLPAISPMKLTEVAKDRSTAKDDSVSAAELAWTYFDKQEWDKAEEWFTLALEWDSTNLHAAEGLVMSMFESGDALSAYTVARELDAKIPGLRKLVVESTTKRTEQFLREGKIAEARALITGFPSDEGGFANTFAKVERAAETGVLQLATVNGGPEGVKVKELPNVSTSELLELAEGAKEEGRYHVSQWYLEQAEAREPLPRSFELMKAWNFYHSRQFPMGATLFEKLYREEEDLESAEGLAFCLQQAQNFEALAEISSELGGMLMNAAAPIINSARQAKARELAANPNRLTEGEELPLPQYAPTAALEAAGEKEAIVKPVSERLQARR